MRSDYIFKLQQDKLSTMIIRMERMQKKEGETAHRVDRMSDSEYPDKRNYRMDTSAPTIASNLRVKYCTRLIRIEGQGNDLEDGKQHL